MTPRKIQVELVDGDGKIIGLGEKYEIHKNPVPLHRAVSVIILDSNKKRMLIQKRAGDKPTWPLFWSNAVCTHPLLEETYEHTAHRRLREELGFDTDLKEVFRFTYSAEMDNKIWGEHEYDVVFVGEYNGEVKANPEEVADYKWIDVSELEEDIKKQPQKYTPWFGIILEKMSLLKL